MRPKTDSVASAMSHRFRPALMAFFLRRLRDHSEAEDLTQEVLARVTERSSSIDPVHPDGYIFQIAGNLLRDRARRNQVRLTYRKSLALDAGQQIEQRDPHRVLHAKQSLSAVVAALRELPERTRTIFILFRLENMRQREIAELLDISLRTVEQHVSRASLHLRDRFGENR